MPRFFLPSDTPIGDSLVLTGEPAAHARVLRLRPGDNIVVCDGRDTDYPCKVVECSPDRLVLEGEEGCLTVEEIWIAVSVDPVGSGDFSLLLPAAFSGLPIKEGTGCLQASQS